MIFNSIPFVIFFLTFFFLYWFVFARNVKLQNALLLLGCYFFYGWWNWMFLSLLIGSSLLNYWLGIYMIRVKSQKAKNLLMYVGTFIGVGLLLYFKYTNFFISSFVDAFAHLNVHLDLRTIDLILPLGISFYTFRTLSYLFDIHKNKIKPTEDWVIFFSYVAFFPCLVSGPIDKAKTMIPQLEKKREFNYLQSIDALRQILWGLFKKLVIADDLAKVVDNIFDNHSIMPGSSLLIGVFYYTIQLYADFSGYSDMAIGISRLLGFNVTKNFNYPFFAQNIPEYWRRWHISLTSWLTEYIFTPVSIKYRDYGVWGMIIAIIITFLVSGLWHGANWTFVFWGLLHGLYFIPSILKGTIFKNKKTDPNKALPSLAEFGNMLKTFALVSFTLILFRSNTIVQAFQIIKQIFSRSLLSFPTESKLFFIPVIIIFIIAEWLQRNKQHTLQIDSIKYWVLRYGIYYLLIFMILMFASSNNTQFIYLKF